MNHIPEWTMWKCGIYFIINASKLELLYVLPNYVNDVFQKNAQCTYTRNTQYHENSGPLVMGPENDHQIAAIFFWWMRTQQCEK